MAGEILIIDDNDTNVKLLKVLLTIEGYSVLTACDASQALSMLQTSQPKLILMDVQLPDVDGYELTRQIRQIPAFTSTIIIAVTSYSIKEELEKALNAGCNGYISKPIDIKTFPTLIKEYLGGYNNQNT